MKALSIMLPNRLAEASQSAAKKLHLSRSGFIRLAIMHELERLQKKFELDVIIQSMKAMETSPEYQAEAKEIDQLLNSELPKE